MTRRRIVKEHPRANLSLPPQTITVENRGGESRIRSLGDGRAGARLFTVVLIAGLTLLGGITAVATLGYSVGPIHSTSAHIGENARSVAPASAETA
ncbi:MAG TPA: hypothetical protein VEY07_03705, partial [Thermoplasmata archaeon]|nr:hypothetical protein [Thermoplasmata archaeon]